MCNFGNFGYSNMSSGYSNMSYGFSDGFSYGGGCGYNSFGGNPFGGFNAGPSRINMNFSSGSMFMGPSIYTRGGFGGYGGGYSGGCFSGYGGYNRGGFGGYSQRPYMGEMMMPMRYTQSIDRAYAAADGVAKVLSSVDDFSYALQARQYS